LSDYGINITLPTDVEMYVKTIPDDKFPIEPQDTNNSLYKKLVYFQVKKNGVEHKVVPFWKIDGDKSYNHDTDPSSKKREQLFYLNQWFSNWYRSEINLWDGFFIPGTPDKKVYTAEPLVFLAASFYTNDVNKKWTIENDISATKHTSKGAINNVTDINNTILSKPSPFSGDFTICKPPDGTDLHKFFAAYSENSKALKKEPCLPHYIGSKPRTNSLINYTTSPKKWDFSDSSNLINIKLVIYYVIKDKFNTGTNATEDTKKLYKILEQYPEDCLFVEASNVDSKYGIYLDTFDFLRDIASKITINPTSTTNHDYVIRRTPKNGLNVLGNAITKFRQEIANPSSSHAGGGFNQFTNTKPTKKEKISKRNMNRVYKLREITNKKRNLKKKKNIQLSHKRRMTGKINHIKRCNRSYKKYSKKKGLKITKKKCNTK